MSEALLISPRSRRTTIAERFIAGIRVLLTVAARVAGDRPRRNRAIGVAVFLSPVSRARGVFLPMIPSTEGAGLLSIRPLCGLRYNRLHNNPAQAAEVQDE